MTGAFSSGPFGGQVQMQSTGFPPSLPFQFAQPFQPTQPLPLSQVNNFAIESPQAPQHRPFSTFVPQQATGLPSGPTTGFLQPQPTGANPFRQSVLVPQATGIPAFNNMAIMATPPPPVPQTESLFQMTSNLQSHSFGQPVDLLVQVRQSMEVPPRPASTPLTSFVANSSSVSPPIAQPVKSHQTGSRNPFGVPVTPAPPVPKPPTLLELSTGFGRLGVVDGGQPIPQLQSTASSIHQVQSTTTASASTFSTVASSFAFTNKLEENASSLGSDLNRLGSLSQNSQVAPTNMGFNASDSLFSSRSSQPTNSTVSSHAPPIPVTGPIKAQPTGFGGVKPFKPSSSFGASLLGALPPIPQSGTTTPDPSVQTTTHSSAPSLPANLNLNGSVYTSTMGNSNALQTMNAQPTGLPQRANGGSTLGVGLRPQVTGALGGANPFRATMFATASTSPTVGGVPALASSASTPPFGGLSNGTGVSSIFAPPFGNGAFGPSFAHLGQDSSNTQQQNAGVSLI